MSAPTHQCRLRAERRAPFSFAELKKLCCYVNPLLLDVPFSPPSEGALVELVLADDDMFPSSDFPALLRGRGLLPLSSNQALFLAYHHEEPWMPGVRVAVCDDVVLQRGDDDLAEKRAIVCENTGNHRRIFFPPVGLVIRGPVWVTGIRT